jgi:hypothetical protein
MKTKLFFVAAMLSSMSTYALDYEVSGYSMAHAGIR